MIYTIIRFGVWNSNNRLYLLDSIKIPDSGPIYPAVTYLNLGDPIGEFHDTKLVDDQLICQVDIRDRLHQLIIEKGLPMYPVSAGTGEVSNSGVVRNFRLTHMLLTDKPAVWNATNREHIP